MKVTIPAAYFIRKDTVPQHIGFRYDRSFEESVEALLQKAWKKKITQLRVDLALPEKPRSTGRHSQNSHIWGHCTDIADQITDDEGFCLYTKSEIEQAMLRMAVSEGYPTKLSIDGSEVPASLSRATSEEAAVVIDVIHRFADIHNLYLTEYDTETMQPYRTIGGRSREEMENEV